MITRRSFISSAAMAPVLAPLLAQRKSIPVGLELYSVRNELRDDLTGTVRAVAKMGYENVEFYSPYFSWTADQAKEVRKLLDSLGITCLSTHNGASSFAPENLDKAIELNSVLGCKYIVMAGAGRVEGLDGWKVVAEKLNAGADKFKTAGMRAGFHNHQVEFRPIDGVRPIEVLAKNTDKSVMLQLDIGTCIEAGSDPVAWIQQNPGRINSIHLKEWSPEPGKGYRVLLGEGAAKWKEIFAAAEAKGGIEFYLIEQEGSDYPPFETAERCLANFRKIHG